MGSKNEMDVPDVTGSDELEIVGESHQAAAHKAIFGAATGRREGRVALVREPKNQYDPGAIAVMFVESDGKIRHQLGYLDRETAADLVEALDDLGGVAVCGAQFGRNDATHVWRVVLLVDLDEI